MNKKLLLIILLVVVVIGIILFFIFKKDKTIKTIDEPIDEENIVYNIEMKIKNYGIIELELNRNDAKITVDNFVNLVESKFYDGLTFHRIINGFMMQGGAGETMHKSAKTIKGEFKSNGIENNISHVRGVISMARSSNKNSASSQFFIVQSDSTFLDGEYAGFGHVTKGMEIVDKICKEAKPINSNGIIADDKQPVIEYIRIIK